MFLRVISDLFRY